MVNVTSTSDAGEKYARRGRNATQDYETGVENTSDAEQAEATQAASGRWESGVQDAIANDAFSRGVSNSPKSWQEYALNLGTQRFSQGVAQSQGVYEESVEPFFSALESLDLPARGPRGSAENFERSRVVGERLNEVRDEI